MQNTPPQQQTEELFTVQITAKERSMIVFSLGIMAGTFGLDENRKTTAAALLGFELARKFGVQ